MEKGISGTPMVSIVMAGYQTRNDFFRIALESIRNQAYTDFELIFIDDGCDQSTYCLLESYKQKFPITIIKNEINMGLPKALNRGLQAAKGKYIARFDDDDIMLPDRLKVQVEFLESHADYAGCWSEFQIIDQTGAIIGTSNIGNIDFVKQFIAKGGCCCHSSFFIRKHVLEELHGYNEKYTYAQDLELYTRILKKYRMYCVNSVQVQFRKNTTRNPLDKQILSFFFSYSAALKFVKEVNTLKAKRYLLFRTLRLIKFSFIDIMRLG